MSMLQTKKKVSVVLINSKLGVGGNGVLNSDLNNFNQSLKMFTNKKYT